MMDYLEITGTAVGLLYLYWEYKASPWLWLASIAMPAIYLSVYYRAGLYADFGISVYYILASLYGLIVWLCGRKREVSAGADVSDSDAENTTGICATPRRLAVPLFLACALLTLALGFMLRQFTDSTVPWADGFTTALSIVALWMLAKKYTEQWLVWMTVDVAYAVLYCYKGLWLTGALYLAYALVAIFGYRKWKKLEIDGKH